MAENITTSTITNITEYPNSFKRQGAFPLERFSLFNSLSDAETYALTNPVAYVGQQLVVANSPAWEFDDEGEHTVTWDATEGKWVLDAGTEDEEVSTSDDLYATSVTFAVADVTATRTAPVVTAYMIGPEGVLIEMGTKAEIDGASGDASSEITAAIQALDSSVAATSADGNQYSVLTGVTESDGKLTGKTEVKLAAVAKTGTAADVAIVDENSKFTATNVEDALEELHDNLAITVDEVSSGLGAGILKAYKIYTGGTQSAGVTTGGTLLSTINIPKDFLVKSATLETVAEAGKPYTGAVVGDKYLDFVLNTKDSSLGSETGEHVYVPVNDLFDSYTSGSAVGAEITITVDNSTNKISATLNSAAGTKVHLTKIDGTTDITAQAAFEAMNATTTASTASEDTSAIQGISVVTGVTQTDGVVAMTTAKADKFGSASKAKADVIGADTDAKTANTVYGAKAYADAAIADLDTTSDVGVASVTNNVVTIKGSIKEVDGLIAQGTASDVVLEEVAYTGAAADVSIADTDNVITATTVEGALAEIAKEIDAMDVASFALASVSDNVVTIKALKEVDGKVSADTESNTITLEEVAYTGAAADVSIADSDSVITATTVEGALAEIAKEIDAMDATVDSTKTAIGGSTARTKTDSTNGVFALQAITETDGKITAMTAVEVDAAGSANAVLGSSSTDTRDSNTVHGVKKLATAKAEYLGTATALTTNSATITVSGSSVTAATGDYCTYSGVEYFWDGSNWSKLSGVKSVTFAGTALTVGSNGALSITKSDALSALNVADGAQVNVIETVKVGGTALTVTNKAVDIDNLILDGGSATVTVS